MALILLSANLIDKTTNLKAVWIVGMIPLMTVIAIPVTLIMYKQIKKNLSVLIRGMDKVANGDLDTYIPTAGARDFAHVYDNFNKMVAEIQKIETIRTGMYDSLSHELKTPIASISGFANILIEKDLSEEKKQKYLQIIVSESERLEKLVKNVLLLSKLSDQEIISHKEDINIREQLQDCVISLENDWTAKNIDLSADLIDVHYKSNGQLLKSLWINLLSNAIKFTPENGEIKITMLKFDKKLSVSVADTGIGMSEEDIAHIFERHYQADKNYAGGQGLGLAIVKQIVKLCNGEISVISKQGEGSAFTVILPL